MYNQKDCIAFCSKVKKINNLHMFLQSEGMLTGSQTLGHDVVCISISCAIGKMVLIRKNVRFSGWSVSSLALDLSCESWLPSRDCRAWMLWDESLIQWHRICSAAGAPTNGLCLIDGNMPLLSSNLWKGAKNSWQMHCLLLAEILNC